MRAKLPGTTLIPARWPAPFRLLAACFLAVAAGIWPPARAEIPPPIQEKAPVVLGQGEQRILNLPNLQRFSIGDRTIVRAVRPPGGFQDDAILLKALAPGTSDLWVWKTDGTAEHRTVRVVKWGQDPVPLALRRALDSLTEAEIIPTGRGFVLRGEIRSREELSRVRRIRDEFPKQVFDETRPSTDLLLAAEAAIRTWIREHGLAGRLSVSRLGDELWIRGSLESAERAESVRAQLGAQFPALRFEVDSLPGSIDTVFFRVFLLEVQREHSRSLGVDWTSIQDGAIKVTAAPLKSSANLEGVVDALARQGSARVLSRPELAVRAPGEAELFAGGEIPIRTRGRFQSNVTWRRFGLSLRLSVTAVAGERIRLDVFSEVSHLDSNIGSDDIPGIRANTMRTQVDARFGHPLLLSGLLHEGMRRQVRGLPLLKDIPVLGRLFGSEDYLNERSELLAILLPHSRVRPAPRDVIGPEFPSGPVPPPRNWLSPEKERRLREDPDFPWNAFDERSGDE